MSVQEALVQINKIIDEYFNEAEGDMDSETRFCLNWFMQYGFKAADFGTADVLARAKGTSVERLNASGAVKSGSGKVALKCFEEFSADSNLDTINCSVWEALHYLIVTLRENGESNAGKLMNKLSDRTSAIRQLAYRLYTVCERNGWSSDARIYNELITSWHGAMESSGELQIEDDTYRRSLLSDL